jgi:hypothetical protein
MPISSPVEMTIEILITEANKSGQRAIGEDRPDMIAQAEEYIKLAYQLASTFKINIASDAETYISELKRRFLLSTTLPVVAGIYSEDAIATPVDMQPLRRAVAHVSALALPNMDKSRKPSMHPAITLTSLTMALCFPAKPATIGSLCAKKAT